MGPNTPHRGLRTPRGLKPHKAPQPPKDADLSLAQVAVPVHHVAAPVPHGVPVVHHVAPVHHGEPKLHRSVGPLLWKKVVNQY